MIAKRDLIDCIAWRLASILMKYYFAENLILKFAPMHRPLHYSLLTAFPPRNLSSSPACILPVWDPGSPSGLALKCVQLMNGSPLPSGWFSTVTWEKVGFGGTFSLAIAMAIINQDYSLTTVLFNCCRVVYDSQRVQMSFHLTYLKRRCRNISVH